MAREKLRIPEHWKTQDRQFVIQLERVLDDVYSQIKSIDKRLAALEQQANEEE